MTSSSATGIGRSAVPRSSISGSGRGDEGLDALRVVGGVGVLGEVLQAAADAVVDLLAGLADLRLVEQPEAQVAGDVADDRVADLGGDR